MNEIIPYQGPRVLQGEIVSSVPDTRQWNPSPLMRAFGYTSNPDTCIHDVKGYTPAEGWWCKKCGDKLRA